MIHVRDRHRLVMRRSFECGDPRVIRRLNEKAAGGATAMPIELDRLLLFLWFMYLVLTPFYVFRSGMPQPADMIMAGMVFLLFSGIAIQPSLKYFACFCMIGFAIVVVTINMLWWSVYYDSAFLKSSMFYPYNVGVFIFVVSMIAHFGKRMITVTLTGLMVALVVEVILAIVLPGGGYRGTGTFNNPNQLGYWSLLVPACWLVARTDNRIGLPDFAFLAMAGYLAALSLSKAAMVAIGLLFVLAILGQGLRSRWIGTGLMLIASILTLWLALPESLKESVGDRVASEDGGLVAKVTERLESIGESNDDSADARGYDRMWRYPRYLLFGAGEGAMERFNEGGSRMEMHSTWGTLIFSYGVTGTLLFAAGLWGIFSASPIRYSLYLMPLFLYGITHNGMRDSMLWTFLALAFGLAHHGLSGRTRLSSPRPGRYQAR